MIAGASYLFSPLVRKFGREIHVGSGATAPKTGAIYYPPMRLSYGGGDTTPFTLLILLLI